MKKLLLGVAAGYSIEDISANLTLASLKAARLIGTRSGPEGDEYEAETKRDGAWCLRVEPS